MREAVIVSTARTALAKSFRGAFNDTEAPALGGATVNAVVAKAGIDPALVEDCVFGAAAQQGTQAYNLGRLCAVAGGLLLAKQSLVRAHPCGAADGGLAARAAVVQPEGPVCAVSS